MNAEAKPKKKGKRVKAPELFCPPEVTGPSFESLGQPCLDPATARLVNRYLTRAKKFYSPRCGLEKQWLGRFVWCAVTGVHEEDVWRWWCRGAEEWQAGRVRDLAFVLFDTRVIPAITERAAELGVPTPEQAARIEFTGPICYLQRSRNAELFPGEGYFERGPPLAQRSAVLLLCDERLIVERWWMAYGRASLRQGGAACEPLAPPAGLATRQARPPMEQEALP